MRPLDRPHPGTIPVDLLCGLIWFFVGSASIDFHKDEDFSVWILFGSVLMLVSFLVFLVERSKQGRPKPLPKKHRDAGLIVSPAGLTPEAR